MEADEPILEVQANLEIAKELEKQSKFYAISDGGADSCVLGKHAHVLHHTGRFAHLVGYNPEKTRSP